MGEEVKNIKQKEGQKKKTVRNRNGQMEGGKRNERSGVNDGNERKRRKEQVLVKEIEEGQRIKEELGVEYGELETHRQ